MARDQDRLRRRLDRARGAKDDAARRALLDEIAAAVDVAEQRIADRRARVPAPRYPAALPVSERKDEIAAVIAAHPVVIVAGETGSGKSTQLPKICLEAGRGVRGMIGHTQPRRLAARAVAERVAEELGSEVGGTVGYAVRFTDRVSERTLIKVMTDGILLNEIQRDRLLSAYDTIIVDEAHERSLNIDFILGYLKQLLPRRPDLKVIVTSATIDTERFSRHFGGAPIVEVSGRTYPVEVRYRPLVEGERTGPDHRPSATPSRNWWPTGRATSSSSSRASGRSATPPRPSPPWPCPTRSCFPSTPVCPPPTSTASSSATPAGGSCWPPTSPRRR